MKAIAYSHDAQKVFRKLDRPTVKRIMQKVQQYADDPASLVNNVRALTGFENMIRLRVGDWRVIIEETDSLLLVRIASRGSAY